MLVKDIMITDVVTINPEDSVEEAYKAMKVHNIRRLPVVDIEGTLLGIVSDRDVRQVLVPWRSTVRQQEREFYFLARDHDVEDIMTTEVVAINPETTVAEAARLLHEYKFGGLPVVDEDRKVIGILTAIDLLGLLMEQMAEED